MSNICSLFFLVLVLCSVTKVGAQKIIIEGNVSDKYDAIPGAEVVIEGLPISTLTDLDGNFKLEVAQEGTYKVKVSFITYNTQTNRISVKRGKSYNLIFSLTTLASTEKQFSIGSRAAPRTSLESTSPVDVITQEDILNSNQTELGGLLHDLVTSFHSTQQTIASGTDHIDPASLRGLGSDQVLVLVNGKRRHHSSLLNVNGTVGKGSVGTDFNSIPISAIKRIEILRDGATSQYGSDAIAGVINIILKHQNNKILIDTRFKQNTEGDGEVIFGAVNFGFSVGKQGFVNITTEIRDRASINRAGHYTGSVYSSNEEEDSQLIEENAFFSQIGLGGKRVMKIGAAETKNIAVVLNSEFNISDNTKAYIFGLKNYREGKSSGFYRFPFEEEKVVESLFPNGFLPNILTDIKDDALTFGFSSEKNFWNVNFSHTIGVNQLGFSVSNSNNASLGVVSPTFFDVGAYSFSQQTSNFDISRLFSYLGGINVAFGGELRFENYQIIKGEEASYINGGETFLDADGDEVLKISGSQVFPGIQPINELDKSRTNSSFYLDVETKINEQILVNTALRFKNYSDYGGRLIHRFAARYKCKDAFNLRLGVSSGFRAPSLQQVYFSNISTQVVNEAELQVGTFNNKSNVAKAIGIATLKPELSNHFMVGFTSRLFNDFSIALDFYTIQVKDRIVLSSRVEEGYEDILEPLNVTSAQFLANAIDLKTVGLEGIVTYNKNLGKGKIKSSFMANIAKTSIEGSVNAPNAFQNNEDVFFNREEVARIEKSQPRLKFIFSNSYELKKIKVNLNNIYFGSVTYFHPDDGNVDNWQLNEFTGIVESRDQTFSSKILTNLSITYKVLNNLDIGLLGNNIFNVYPDKLSHSENTENGNFVYSRNVQQFGVNGSNFSARILLSL